jgi:DNA-binding response OmpR family regulator
VGTILLIEDDEALGRQVHAQMKEYGFAVVWWKSGRSPDEDDLSEVVLIILDLMLPGVAGLDILKQVRAISDVPVLVLSARQDSGDKARALKLGADDYVSKPFWPEELVERVNARLRRPVLKRSSDLRVGALLIQGPERAASYAGRHLNLTRAELDLLAELAKRPGQPVSRQWLLSHVLDPEREATERTLDVHVSRLRKKLGDADLIETVWGIGYRLRQQEVAR